MNDQYISNEKITCSPTLEKLSNKEIEILESGIISARKIYSISLLIICGCISFFIIMYFVEVQKNEPKNTSVILFVGVFISSIITLLTYIIANGLLKTSKRKEEYIENGMLEIYQTYPISSEEVTVSNGKYSYKIYSVKFNGFLQDLYVHTTELPQYSTSEFIIKRYPISGVIHSIKNKNNNSV